MPAMDGPGFALHAEDPILTDYVVVELRHDSGVTHSPRRGRFEGRAEHHVASLNELLQRFRVRRFGSHFNLRPTVLRRRATHAPPTPRTAVSAEFAHAGFVQIQPHRAADVDDLIRHLHSHDAVWKAVRAPKPVPAGTIASGASRGSRNFQPAQGYLYGPPDGIGAIAAWGEHGATGEGVTICDIEMNWNRSHENLPPDIPLKGGRLYPDQSLRDHGTAVLGLLVGRPGPSGTMGVCHGASVCVRSFLTGRESEAAEGYHHNLAGAVRKATDDLDAGDVIQIEVQAAVTHGDQGPDYVAMQHWDDVGSAIRAATEKGITVVEAAANKGVDFDDPSFRGTGLQKDYGAIVVGAGSPPLNYYGTASMLPLPQIQPLKRIGAPRSRLFFSNYGSIVNLQGWGFNVATLGYGDAQGGSEDRWMTLRFAGTSSATPMVTGAVACVQGCAREHHGAPLAPREVRELLIETGTPQEPDVEAPVTQHIGPQPDLPRAIERLLG